MHRCLQFGLLAVVLALAGCDTINSRIRQKAAVFDQLAPADQAKIRQGVIALGFTPDMVYMALGRPTGIHERTTAAGRETLWTYSTYYDQYEGTVRVGYHRWVYWDPFIHAYRVYFEPVYGQMYTPQQQTNFKITFQNGKVTAIEQNKS